MATGVFADSGPSSKGGQVHLQRAEHVCGLGVELTQAVRLGCNVPGIQLPSVHDSRDNGVGVWNEVPKDGKSARDQGRESAQRGNPH